jgi:hypothetical protein
MHIPACISEVKILRIDQSRTATKRPATWRCSPAVVDAAGEIYGDVTNIAARVQAQAEPGAVL